MWWLLPAVLVVVQNATRNEPVANQNVLVLRPSPQGMPQFLDTLTTNAQGKVTVDPKALKTESDTLLVATEYLGQLYAHPLFPGMDTVMLAVYDTGQATLATLSYQALFHELGDTLPGYFMIEALEIRLVEPIRGRVGELVFPIPEGAQVLQVFPQDGWDMQREDALVFRGYLSPDNPVIQVQWVWQENRRTRIERAFPKAILGGRVFVQPSFSVSGKAVGSPKEVSFPQGTFLEYPLAETQELAYTVTPGGARNLATLRWLLGVGGGVLLAVALLLALRRRYAKGSGQGAA